MGEYKTVKVSILRLAREDIKEIREYLSESGEQPPKKFRESLEQFFKQIIEMPYMFSQYEHDIDYRKAIIIYGYLIFYKVDEKNELIKIYRILHGKRDTETIIKKR